MAYEQDSAGGAGEATAGQDYADRLVRHRAVWWKRLIDVQAPYRWHMRRLHLGRTLDIGCGLGRNLRHLGRDAVGVDHNAHCVAVARSEGLTAYTTAEFSASGDAVPAGYDCLLLAHVAEHMSRDSAVDILTTYLPYLKPGGRLVLITPQEAGYRSDSTHVRFVGFEAAEDLAQAAGLRTERRYSFPFPRAVGKMFRFNEFVTIARRPGP
jgi:2-polyprenyl-3-methyl-5-hydroxy-6-metoxy-1,4-benzoquinol methylase